MENWSEPGDPLFELAAACEVVSSNALQKSVNGKGGVR
jgi:hypothetical protein